MEPRSEPSLSSGTSPIKLLFSERGAVAPEVVVGVHFRGEFGFSHVGI